MFHATLRFCEMFWKYLFRNVTGLNWCACFGVRIENFQAPVLRSWRGQLGLNQRRGQIPAQEAFFWPSGVGPGILKPEGSSRGKWVQGPGRIIQEQIWVQKLFTEATSPSHPASVQADGELPANVLKKGWAGEECCPEKLPYTLLPASSKPSGKKFREIPSAPRRKTTLQLRFG